MLLFIPEVFYLRDTLQICGIMLKVTYLFHKSCQLSDSWGNVHKMVGYVSIQLFLFSRQVLYIFCNFVSVINSPVYSTGCFRASIGKLQFQKQISLSTSAATLLLDKNVGLAMKVLLCQWLVCSR